MGSDQDYRCLINALSKLFHSKPDFKPAIEVIGQIAEVIQSPRFFHSPIWAIGLALQSRSTLKLGDQLPLLRQHLCQVVFAGVIPAE